MHAFQVGVEPPDPPDIPLHRADGRVAIGKEADAAKKHHRLPGVVERDRDRIDRVRPARADGAARRQDLWPLRWPSLHEVCQRMVFGRSHLADHRSILHPRGVEHLGVAEPIREDHPPAVAIEAVIGERLPRLVGRGQRFDDRAGRRGRRKKPMSRVGEREEAAGPGRLDRECVGVEAGEEFPLVAEPQADRPRDHPALHRERPALQRPEVRLVAAVVPRLANAAEVAESSAVDVGPGGKQQRHRLPAAKLPGLPGIGVVDTMLVHSMPTVWPLVWMERLWTQVKRLGAVGECLEAGRAAEFEQIADEVASLLWRQRGRHVLWHERADILTRVDLGGWNAVGLARGIDEQDGLGRLFLDDPLQRPALMRGDGKRAVFRLHEPVGPEERLDNLLWRKALGDGREFGADDAPLPCDLVARRACARSHAEHASAPSGVTVGPRVGEDFGDEFLAPLGRRRHRDWLGRRRP